METAVAKGILMKTKHSSMLIYEIRSEPLLSCKSVFQRNLSIKRFAERRSYPCCSAQWKLETKAQAPLISSI